MTWLHVAVSLEKKSPWTYCFCGFGRNVCTRRKNCFSWFMECHNGGICMYRLTSMFLKSWMRYIIIPLKSWIRYIMISSWFRCVSCWKLIGINFVPPKVRRNIGILGFLHERVLGLSHPLFQGLLFFGNDVPGSISQGYQNKQFN